MKSRLAVLVPVSIVVLLLAPLACRRRASIERTDGSLSVPEEKRVAGVGGNLALARGTTDALASPEPASPEAGKPAVRVLAGRKLIRNGEISVEVGDYESAARRVSAIADSFGGYVSDAQASGEGSRRHGTIVVRVRATSFDQALAALKALGKVQTEHVGSTDITKAYTDLETRLSVKRDAAERIRDILKNRTARLADVLQAEKELTELVEQIETMEGERRWYDQQVELSTISAELHEPEAVARPSAIAPLRQALRDSLYSVSTSLAAIVTFLLYALPWAALAAAVLALTRRIRRSRRAPVTKP